MKWSCKEHACSFFYYSYFTHNQHLLLTRHVFSQECWQKKERIRGPFLSVSTTSAAKEYKDSPTVLPSQGMIYSPYTFCEEPWHPSYFLTTEREVGSLSDTLWKGNARCLTLLSSLAIKSCSPLCSPVGSCAHTRFPSLHGNFTSLNGKWSIQQEKLVWSYLRPGIRTLSDFSCLLKSGSCNRKDKYRTCKFQEDRLYGCISVSICVIWYDQRLSSQDLKAAVYIIHYQD